MLFQSIAPIEGTDWYLLINERGEEVHAPKESRLVRYCLEGHGEQEVLTLDGPVKIIARANPLELAMYSAAGRLQEIEKAIADLQALKDAGLTTKAENATLERLEKIKAQLDGGKPELEAVHTKLQERPEAHVEPPAAIADLFDPSLTARQNQEKLQLRYKDAMSEHYRLMGYGTQEDKAEAQKQLEKAQRIESGITWNRARLAEVV